MSELDGFKGIGPKRKEALYAAGIKTVEQLLDVLPREYIYAEKPVNIADVKAGDACIYAQAASLPVIQYYGGKSISRVSLADDSGRIQALWFNQPWTAKRIEPGQKLLLAGKVQLYRNRLSLVNPKLLDQNGIHPVYTPLPSLPSKVFLSLVDQALELVSNHKDEIFTDSFRRQHQLVTKLEAWRMAHHPKTIDDIEKAKRRLAFENLLLYQMAIRLAGPQGKPGIMMNIKKLSANSFWSLCPFQPTNAQKNTLKQIIHDLGQPIAMRRLVQGDVGSGKTAVALGAAAITVASGYQAALMSPTELLARQHLLTAENILAPLGIRCGLLTGSLPAAERRRILQQIKKGELQLIVGTHALISRGVEYQKLGLVITDEQHRFGVRQRQTLVDKAEDGVVPHLLALSATPIPRSLALTIYGDLQVSIMDDLPPGRKQVKTRIVPENKRNDLYRYIKDKALIGEQSFLVCPLVEDSEISESLSAFGMYAQLSRGVLKGIPMALTYGGQPEPEKAAALGDFYAGIAKVLVSTTVIEVGMDVPNATTMVIENADQFGLAQLHQLRGRVGRGDKESWCFLLGERNERLTALAETSNGFVIAQKDLEMRGPGEFLGTRQHGRMLNAYGINDMRLIEETSQILKRLQEDPGNKDLRNTLETVAEQRYARQLIEAAIH